MGARQRISGQSSSRIVRPAWSAAIDVEDSRAALQGRLASFSKMMFWSFIALLALLATMYRAYPHIEPKRNDYVFGGSAVILTVMATVWRLSLVRNKNLAMAWLHRIDLIYAVGIGTS